MILVPIWLNTENVIEFFDSSFNQIGPFVLALKNDKICSNYKITIDSFTICKGVVKFSFILDCSIPVGEYSAEIIDSSNLAVLMRFKAGLYGVK